MGYKKLLPAIVALLLAIAMAIQLSAPIAMATHAEPTATIAPTLVREDKTYVFTITVEHKGGSPIKSVQITTYDPLFTVIGGVARLPKDNEVQIGGVGTDNQVVIPAGTKIQLTGTPSVTIPENTIVIRKKDENIQSIATGTWYILMENADVKVKGDRTVTLGTDNVITVVEKSVVLSVTDNKVRLVNAENVVLLTSTTAKLTENTLVAPLQDNTATGFTTGDNLALELEKAVTLDNGDVKTAENVPAKRENVELTTLAEGVDFRLPAPRENEVSLPAGMKVRLTAATTVKIFENTDNLIRRADENVLLPSATAANAENKPAGWSFTVSPLGWSTDNADRMLASGSLDFPIAIKTPATLGPTNVFSFGIRTVDNSPENYPWNVTTNTITVDNITPWTSISVDKAYVAKAVSVAITVNANEALTKAPLVYVRQTNVSEENAKENFKVAVTSADNITWTGTYTTIDKENYFDGPVAIKVKADGAADAVGHTLPDNENVGVILRVDTLAPPQLTAANNLSLGVTDVLPAVPGIQTNISSALVTGRAVDNVLGIVDNYAGLTVKVSRDNVVVATVISLSDNTFSAPITLAEGLNKVGVRVVDKAGNEGPENVQEVFVDSTKPVITPVRISGTSYADDMIIKDNTPTIELTIVDEGYAENKALGVENLPYAAATNSGFVVELRYDNGTSIATLVNSLAWDKSTGGFENTYPTALADGSYKVNIKAGDNLQSSDNKILSFRIDTTPPGAPTLTATASQNPAAPDLKMTTSVALGGTCEAGATVKVWTSPEPFTVETVATSVVDTDGDGIWTAAITISQGVTTKISVSQVDIALNESSKRLYGYLMVDATAPTIVITLPATGTKTDKASITVSGTVTKDTWEIWSDITLRVQVGLTGTTVPISAGTFSVDVALGEGSNTIIATVTDPRGWSSSATVTVERTVTSWGTYAIILVIVALILAAIAIFRKR